jgi:hypothetical protein
MRRSRVQFPVLAKKHFCILLTFLFTFAKVSYGYKRNYYYIEM